MEENKGYAAVLSGAPYLDGLARSYASSSAWFGIDHPSAPNYVGILSGSLQGVVGDCTPPSCGPYAAPSLGGQLSAAGIPWAAYMESMPSPCYSHATAGEYAEKHNPFLYFNDILHNNCAAHDLPYPGAGALVSTLDGPNPPDFVWITPNQLNDMHDGSVAQGDNWARANLAPVLASSWFRDYNSTVIITMDEGDPMAPPPAAGSSPADRSLSSSFPTTPPAKAASPSPVTSTAPCAPSKRSSVSPCSAMPQTRSTVTSAPSSARHSLRRVTIAVAWQVQVPRW